ncbi:MAG: TerC family protein [Acidimicrobiales bacterium]|nr:TerC family protein [Acidimicrobiales bacterium]RZV47728.1 MAG: TerC family protein [Acidimicrobiales bacterium]
MMVMVLATEANDNFVDIDAPTWSWALLLVSVFALLALDLWRHRHAHAPTFREAGLESIFWVFCSLVFGAFMFAQFGGAAGGEYLGVYLTEKSLSVDNVFVWALLFSSMSIPLKYQHRVLFWGIFGALVMRATFILIGSELVQRFSIVLVFFGVFLIITGIRIIQHDDDEGEDASTAGLALLRRFMPVTDELDGQKFFTQLDGRRAATPLFAALVVVEATDVVFAVDSVPASFGVANDPYILIAANAFAIMGLRAMYFLLADARERFHYLSHALGGVLLFVGVKLVLTAWDVHIPIALSLGIIVVILVLAVVFSIWKNNQIEAGKDRSGQHQH